MKVIQRKVCMLGSFAVGKTSLVRRFVEGRFDDKYLSTIGVKISRKTVKQDNTVTNLIIWDLAGGDEYLRSNSGYLRGAAGALIVCDVTRPQTLQAARQYANQIRSLNADASIVFVGNKADLVDDRLVSDEDIEKICQSFGRCQHFPTSARNGLNVENAFKSLAELLG